MLDGVGWATLGFAHAPPCLTLPPRLPVQGLLDEIQAGMLAQAKEFRDSNIVDVGSYAELQAAVAEGAGRGGGGGGGGRRAASTRGRGQRYARKPRPTSPAALLPHLCSSTF